MRRFSERFGYKPVREQLQVDDIDDELKNSLWNIIVVFLNNSDPTSLEHYTEKLWMDFWKRPLDEIPFYLGTVNIKALKQNIKNWFYQSNTEWHSIFDLIEFTLGFAYNNVITMTNEILERELSAYRIVNKQFIRITSEEEVASIEESISITENKYQAVYTHLQTALKLLSDREHPDYRNSMKESISAVESLCQKLTGDKGATLGKALKLLEQREQIHPALKSSFNTLYGYTNDSDGIRHAITDDSKEVDFLDAKYMLVTCSAFINLMIGKLDK